MIIDNINDPLRKIYAVTLVESFNEIIDQFKCFYLDRIDSCLNGCDDSRTIKEEAEKILELMNDFIFRIKIP